MLWTNLRKADLETRNVLISMLNDIYFEFSFEHTEFFISRIAEVEPKQIMLDEIEFAFKLVNFSKWRPEAETQEGAPSLTVASLHPGPSHQDLLEDQHQRRNHQH